MQIPLPLLTLEELLMMEIPLPNLTQLLLIVTAFGALFSGAAAFFLWRIRVDDKKKAEEREGAIFIRDNLMPWYDGQASLGRVNYIKGKITRDPPSDPPAFRDESGLNLLNQCCPGFWKKWTDLKARRETMLDKYQKLYEELNGVGDIKKSDRDQFEKEVNEDDFEFDKELNKVRQNLETRYRLEKRPPYNIAALQV